MATAVYKAREIAIGDIIIPDDRLRKDLGDINSLVESIKELGLINPITLTEDLHLVAGWRRLNAYKRLGYTEIDVTFVNLDALRTRLLEIDENLIRCDLTALERIEHNGERKKAAKRKEPTAEIAVGYTEDAAAKTGMSPRTVRRDVQIDTKITPEVKDTIRATPLADNKDQLQQLARLEPAEQLVVANRIAAAPVEKPVTVKDVLEDLRKEATVDREQVALQEAAAKPAERPYLITTDQAVVQCDAVITDPPYGILDEQLRDSERWEPEKLDDLAAFTFEWLERWNECGADFFVMFWSSEFQYEAKTWLDTALTNYKYQQTLIWHHYNNKKPSSLMFFKRAYEPVFLYRRIGSERKIGEGLSPDWSHEFSNVCTEATLQSTFDDVDMKQHPAQKPLELMLWLVDALSKTGDLVCDPFCGSGTTGIAALQRSCRFHGIEINPDYTALAERRIAAYSAPEVVA